MRTPSINVRSLNRRIAPLVREMALRVRVVRVGTAEARAGSENFAACRQCKQVLVSRRTERLCDRRCIATFDRGDWLSNAASHRFCHSALLFF